jgi:8-oxo-dGTP diphosphatase
MRKCIKATVGAVVEKEGRILLARRNHEPFYNHWCIPGGHIEYGEEVEEAMLRELQEETGISASSEESRFFGYYTEYYPELEWHAVALIFAVHPGPSEEIARQEAEVKELRWYTPQEITELSMAFEHGRIVEDYLKVTRH